MNATASGNVVSITSKATGTAANYSLAVSSSSSNGFSPVSFTESDSGAALTGGNGATSGPVYIVSMAYAPNSNVASVQDSVNGNWTYGYDDFNRLISSNKNSGQQTYSYLYDRFGNRWQQNAPQGGSAFVATFSGGNNRIDSATHDLSGNVTKDPTTGANYTFDAENRITTVNGTAVTYTYDADSQRVEKNVNGVKTDYVYDLGGHAIAEISGSGTVNRQELFAGGKHLGTYTNNTTYFSHGDWLGSERVRSDMSGAPCETIQNLPFGDGQSTSGNCGDPSTRHFTGKERDTETNLDYFGARYYGSNMGQFVTPDWDAKPTAVPYAVFGDPQSLNLYTYVRNLPTVKVDPNGHCSAPSVQAGHVGICLESYIQKHRFGFLHMGHGDSRGPVANDPRATFRTQTMIDVNIASQNVKENSRVDPSETDTGSRIGVVHDWISDVKKGKDGSTTFTVHVYGENGYEADNVPFAPGGWIEMVFILKVAADGKVTVLGGSTKDFPSVSIYAYQSNGNIQDVYQQKESGNVGDLNKPMKPLRSNPIQEDADRACALGNRAACH